MESVNGSALTVQLFVGHYTSVHGLTLHESDGLVTLTSRLILRYDNGEALTVAVDIFGPANASSSEQKLGRPAL